MKKTNDPNSIRIERIWSMPNKNTFEIPPIKALLEEEVDLSKYWIDPFANRNKSQASQTISIWNMIQITI